MKILQSKYPKGSFPRQQSEGRYIDGYLYDNIKVLAKNIVNDMTWLAVLSSSTLEVGTGKSTIAQQIGEAYTDLVNEYHGTNIDFNINNICWRPKQLIERAFKVPRYSCIILDEWEDATYWSELGVTLRRFFRKCRQLNLFIILIIPNYFQLPQNYAVSRSVFFMDIHFQGEFERGYFKFYNFDRKKDLYIRGKKEQNYGIVMPNFQGRFTDGYAVNEQEYRDAKLKDLMESEKEEDKHKVSEKEVKAKMFKQLYDRLKIQKVLSQKDLSEAFGVTPRTAQVWMKDLRENENLEVSESDSANTYYSNLSTKDPILEEEMTVSTAEN